MQNAWYRRLLPGKDAREDGADGYRRIPRQRRLPPMLGVFAVLALVLVVTLIATLRFFDNPIVEQFGPNLVTELLAIIITVALVQGLLARQDRARKLRATVGALRKGCGALAGMTEVCSVLVKASLDPRRAEYPRTVEHLFAPHHTEALIALDPTLRLDPSGTGPTWLSWSAERLTAARGALRDLIFVYGGALDPDYLEAIDELADDDFIGLIVELAARESLTPQAWRVRINTSRGQRESFFIRLTHALHVHNLLAREAAKFRSPHLVPRARQLNFRLSADRDLMVQSQFDQEWWALPPAIGALRSKREALR